MPKQLESPVSRVLTEDVISLPQARKELFKILGKRPDKATITRWIHRGVGGIKLDCIVLGRNYYTSKQALTRFIEARTAKKIGGVK